MINRTEYLNKIEKKLLGDARPFELRSDAVALILGLGGTGIRYAAATKELFKKRYGEKDLEDRVRFLCLDTSQTELNDEKKFADNEKLIINGFNKYYEQAGWLSNDVKNSNFGSGANEAGGGGGGG